MTNMDLLIKDINKKYKADIGFQGLKRGEFKRIPFTSQRMNYMLYGGIGRDMITELSGEESSGKTTTALDLVANAQKIFKAEKENKKIAYIDVENSLDEVWAKMLGVNLEELIMVRPQEQCTEEILDIVTKIIDTGEIGMVVIDSLAAMIPKSIYDKSYEDKVYGGNSVPLSRFVNQIIGKLRKNGCTLILINQVREDLGNPYNQFKTPGGCALRHECNVRLRFRKAGYFNDDGDDLKNSCENPAGHYVNAYILKTKICRSDRKLGGYTLNYITGIDWTNDLIDCGIRFGLILLNGCYYSIINGETGEEINKFRGRKALVTELKTNTKLTEEVNKYIHELIIKA